MNVIEFGSACDCIYSIIKTLKDILYWTQTCIFLRSFWVTDFLYQDNALWKSHICKGTRAALYVYPRCSLRFLISTPLPVRSFMNHLQQNDTGFTGLCLITALFTCTCTWIWLFSDYSESGCELENLKLAPWMLLSLVVHVIVYIAEEKHWRHTETHIILDSDLHLSEITLSHQYFVLG